MDFMTLGLIISVLMLCVGLLCGAVYFYVNELVDELESRENEIVELKEICRCFREAIKE